MRLQHFALAFLWPVLASAAVPLGPAQPVTPPAAIVAAGAQEQPVVATSGQETLVGWLDESGGVDAHVAVLSTNGRVVAGTQRLLAHEAVGLRLTWTGRSYLALWSGLGRGLFALTLDRDGRALGPARRISDESGHASNVAWIGSRGAVTAGRTLLLIDDEGNVVTTVGDVNRNGAVLRAEVETNGDSFAVFIESTTVDGSFVIVARRYTRDGIALEPAPVAVAAAARFTSDWDVAAGGGRYAVVVSDDDSIDRFIVHPETLQATRLAEVATTFATGTGVEWVGDRFAAVWIDTDFTPGVPGVMRIYRIRTLPFTEGGDSDVTSSAPRPGLASDPAVAWNGTRLIVAVTYEEEGGAHEIRAAAIDWRDPDATLEPVAGVRLWQVAPAAAMHGRNALLAWIEAVPRKAAARVAVAHSNAGFVGAPVYLSEQAADTTPVVISTGSAYFVFWLEADYVLAMQRVSLNGTPLERPTLIAPSHAFSAAWNGTHVMVAWSGSAGLRAVRIGGDGTPVDTVPIEVAPGRSGAPRLASNGTDFLLVWEEGGYPHANHAQSQPVRIGLWAARISAAGTPDPPFELAAESGLQRHASVASDGRDYLVVYVDDVDDRRHVVTKKVLREGALAGTTADAPGRVVAASDAVSTTITASARGYSIAWESLESWEAGTFIAGVDRDGETTDAPAVVAWSELDGMRPAFATGTGRVGLLLYSVLLRDSGYGPWMRLFMRTVGDAPPKGRAVRR